MKHLIMMIGLIGSGKSTNVKHLVKKGYISVSKDSLRYGIGSGNYIFNPDYEPTISDISKVMVYDFTYIGANIVVDECNLTINDRKEYIATAKDCGYKITAIVCPKLSMNTCVKRRLLNNHGNTPKETWQEVWTNMDRIYEVPTLEEGFDEIIIRKDCR